MIGISRTKNVLATVMQTFSITALVTVLWLAFGYSLAFAPALLLEPARSGSSPVYGNASRFWLRGMHIDSYHQLAPTIPEAVFCMYQLTFAIITCALICGSFAERMRFDAMLIFITIWLLTVYCPMAHSVWHPEGFLYQYGVLDYAGGDVVHIASGVSGLVSAVVLGHRHGFGKEAFEPHNLLLCLTGASLLWVGWFGFNAGSAFSAGERAAYAMLMTQISTAAGSLSWMTVDWIYNAHPSIQGCVSGAVAGMISITPGAGFVDPTGAFITGLIGGPVCFFGSMLKHQLGYDDALDAFGVHGIGGIWGGIAVGFFATSAVYGSEPDTEGVFYGSTDVGGTQLGKQLYGITVSAFYAGFMTFCILKLMELCMPIRVTMEQEVEGLDSSLHGETVVTEKFE